jgi:hypothetical protein
MVCGSHTDTVVLSSRRSRTVVDLTCQHKNQALLVEGPEVMIRPVGTRPQSMRGRFSADQLQTIIDLYRSGAIAEQVAPDLRLQQTQHQTTTPATRRTSRAPHQRMISWMGASCLGGVGCAQGNTTANSTAHAASWRSVLITNDQEVMAVPLSRRGRPRGVGQTRHVGRVRPVVW